MDRADDLLPFRGATRRSGGTERDGNGEDAGEFTLDFVADVVTAGGDEKESDRAEATDKDVAHVGVVVGADGLLQRKAVLQHESNRQNRWKKHTNDADNGA